MFQPLDPLLHAELRLAVMSLLISADEAEKTIAASPAEAGDAAMVKRLRAQIEQEISVQRLL